MLKEKIANSSGIPLTTPNSPDSQLKKILQDKKNNEENNK